MSDLYKMLVPLAAVPLNGIVTKRTGHQQFQVLDKFKIYQKDGDPVEIKAAAGTVYLVGTGSTLSITAYPLNTEVVWYASREDLLNYVDPPEDK